MYKLILTKTFRETSEKISSKNTKLKKQAEKFFRLLSSDPLSPSSKTHKVNTRHHGTHWSSSVTGDIRVIWDFAEDRRLAILLLDIGRHSGKHKLYK